MDEDKFYIGTIAEDLKDDGSFPTDMISCRNRGNYTQRSPKDVQYMDVSPRQVISVSASLVPFLEHDDANRALMGCSGRQFRFCFRNRRMSAPVWNARRRMIPAG